MVVETEVLPFFTWFFGSTDYGGAFWSFLMIAGGLALFAAVMSYIVAAVRHGPIAAGDMVYRVVAAGAVDLVRVSPRRIYALTRLAVQESVRRRVLAVLAVFLVILVFAGWFLDPGAYEPAKLYLSFVLTTTSYLILLLALFLSTFSLPNDIRNRTIYTVVTKPVRAGEIVIGRILGFTAIGTALLVVMGLVSYFFVVRMLEHTHELPAENLRPAASQGDQPGGLEGKTSTAHNHHHEVYLDSSGNGMTESEKGHRHRVTADQRDGQTVYTVGPPEDLFAARVPVYGKISFLDRTGVPGKGISVGHEWQYRKFVEGGTLAAAIWTFQDIKQRDYPHGLPIEMTIRVFRTYQGIMDRGILGSLVLRNPRTGVKSELINFRAKDVQIDRHHIPLELRDSRGNQVSLFGGLVDDDGSLEVWVQCGERAQYFGMASPDVYLRAADGDFRLNFVKAYLGIWLQMLLVTSFGVMFSTFVTGAVAMIATLGSIILGFFQSDVLELAHSVFNTGARTRYGGGPIEALIRIVTQKNLMTELEDTFTNNVVQMVDKVLMRLMEMIAYVVPDFGRLSDVDYLAHGFDIPGNLLAQHLVTGLAYVIALTVAGYFFFKTREVAR